MPIGIAEWTTAITTDSPDELTSAPPRIEDVEVTATIRDRLTNVAGRITRSARRITLRLPTNWPRANGVQKLITASIGPPKRP